jgi:hypothetical protein
MIFNGKYNERRALVDKANCKEGDSMVQIIVDESLRNKLHQFNEPVEICDEKGQVLARVTPVDDLSQYEPCEPQISEEELERRGRSNKWYTTDEVLAHLKSLENR